MNPSVSPLPAVAALLALTLGGCDRPKSDAAATAEGTAAVAVGKTSEPAVATALPPDTLGDEQTLEALIDGDEIPYPVYPNGAKYRVGGENGLKVVLFETEDSFDEVDAYYSDLSDDAGMPRLAGMSDYVRYARSGDDADPWATHLPGIVIHRFEDGEREAVGADESARTNIIMSF